MPTSKNRAGAAAGHRARSLTAEAQRRITYQGEPGANSHTACAQAFPDMEPVPCPTFEDAIGAVQSGEARYAMIPIENSLAGRVADIHHLLPNSGLYIVGEHFLPIRHQLMAIKGARIEELTDLYSHVHALGQSRKMIRKYGLKPHVAGDTAGAARQVAEWGDKSRAALAPKLAADIYGLEILASDVDDGCVHVAPMPNVCRKRVRHSTEPPPTCQAQMSRVHRDIRHGGHGSPRPAASAGRCRRVRAGAAFRSVAGLFGSRTRPTAGLFGSRIRPTGAQGHPEGWKSRPPRCGRATQDGARRGCSDRWLL